MSEETPKLCDAEHCEHEWGCGDIRNATAAIRAEVGRLASRRVADVARMTYPCQGPGCRNTVTDALRWCSQCWPDSRDDRMEDVIARVADRERRYQERRKIRRENQQGFSGRRRDER